MKVRTLFRSILAVAASFTLDAVAQRINTADPKFEIRPVAQETWQSQDRETLYGHNIRIPVEGSPPVAASASDDEGNKWDLEARSMQPLQPYIFINRGSEGSPTTITIEDHAPRSYTLEASDDMQAWTTVTSTTGKTITVPTDSKHQFYRLNTPLWTEAIFTVPDSFGPSKEFDLTLTDAERSNTYEMQTPGIIIGHNFIAGSADFPDIVFRATTFPSWDGEKHLSSYRTSVNYFDPGSLEMFRIIVNDEFDPLEQIFQYSFGGNENPRSSKTELGSYITIHYNHKRLGREENDNRALIVVGNSRQGFTAGHEPQGRYKVVVSKEEHARHFLAPMQEGVRPDVGAYDISGSVSSRSAVQVRAVKQIFHDAPLFLRAKYGVDNGVATQPAYAGLFIVQSGNLVVPKRSGPGIYFSAETFNRTSP